MSEDAHPELDPKLEAWLAEAREAESEVPQDLGRVLEDVERQMAEADSSWTFWVRSRTTALRRAIAIGAALLIVGVAGALMLRPDFARLPLAYTALSLGSLALLLALSLHQALRPLHRPPAPSWQQGAIIALTLTATCATALFAPPLASGAAPAHGLEGHVSPCLFYGLLVSLPVYLLLRLLDRGNPTAALLGACAAGLTGNLVLQLHCPRGDVEHLMTAHFSVALLFIAGIGATHWVAGRLRARRQG